MPKTKKKTIIKDVQRVDTNSRFSEDCLEFVDKSYEREAIRDLVYFEKSYDKSYESSRFFD